MPTAEAGMLRPIADLLDLRGRVALVTGAAGGIGRVIAQRLHEAGAAVAVHYHTGEAKAEAIVAQITADGGRAVAGGADLTSETACTALFGRVEAVLGPVDIVVNNAADQRVSSLADLSLAAWQAMMATNLDGIFLVTRLATASMISRGSGGAIVNITSIEGHLPAAGHGHYATSKAGQLMFTKAAALEYGAHGIRVNSVSPGLIDTGGLAEAWPPGVARWTAAAPLQRLGRPDDVADAVLFLASPAARWITGADLLVDGGVSTHPTW
jgi:3-oxoacyl-[acyl-carrier protein] reductase